MIVLCLFAILATCVAVPARDNMIVGSVIREVRAIPPQDLNVAATNADFDNDDYQADDGSVGYLKKTEDGGADGYKHFDSFHKKDGDKYGYEKHTSFGEAKKYVDDGDDGENKKDKDGKATHNSYQVAEEINEYDEEPVENLNESAHYEAEDDGGSQDGETAQYTEGGDDEESESYTEDGPESYTNEDGEEAEEYNEEEEGDDE